MSQNFSDQEKGELIAALNCIRKDLTYAVDQLQSAIQNDLAPSDKDSVSRVVSILRHFVSQLVKPADTLNLMMMEKNIGSPPPTSGD